MKPTAKDKLLAASFKLIRTKGYSSTTVDELCEEAGVTKGAFFHHFKSKEDLAVAAAQHWSATTGEFFKAADYNNKKDPLDRTLAYVDFRIEILKGKVPEITCLVGTMVQEAYHAYPEIRKACFESIFHHAETLENNLSLSKSKYCPRSKWSPKSVALHTQAVIQGAFILVKASGDVKVAEDSLMHLKSYIQMLHNA